MSASSSKVKNVSNSSASSVKIKQLSNFLPTSSANACCPFGANASVINCSVQFKYIDIAVIGIKGSAGVA